MKLIKNFPLRVKKLDERSCLISEFNVHDFPGGTVVKNLTANAGDTGSSPGLGRFPHAVELLSLCTTTTEPVL